MILPIRKRGEPASGDSPGLRRGWAPLLAALGCAALTGCAAFANRIECTLPLDAASVNIRLGRFGVTLDIDERDARIACASMVRHAQPAGH